MKINKAIIKSQFLLMLFSMFISCAPHKEADSLADQEKTLPVQVRSESTERAADDMKTGAKSADEENLGFSDEGIYIPAEEEIREEHAGAESVPDSAVYNAGEETPETDRSGPDQKKEYGGRADDEGEIVIP